jgi:hypothetical protein
MSNSKDVNVNFPIFGILGLIFITLKLTGHITWSWLWVLAPFWIPISIGLLIFLIVFLGLLLFPRLIYII